MSGTASSGGGASGAPSHSGRDPSTSTSRAPLESLYAQSQGLSSGIPRSGGLLLDLDLRSSQLGVPVQLPPPQQGQQAQHGQHHQHHHQPQSFHGYPMMEPQGSSAHQPHPPPAASSPHNPSHQYVQPNSSPQQQMHFLAQRRHHAAMQKRADASELSPRFNGQASAGSAATVSHQGSGPRSAESTPYNTPALEQQQSPTYPGSPQQSLPSASPLQASMRWQGSPVLSQDGDASSGMSASSSNPAPTSNAGFSTSSYGAFAAYTGAMGGEGGRDNAPYHQHPAGAASVLGFPSATYGMPPLSTSAPSSSSMSVQGKPGGAWLPPMSSGVSPSQSYGSATTFMHVHRTDHAYRPYPRLSPTNSATSPDLSSAASPSSTSSQMAGTPRAFVHSPPHSLFPLPTSNPAPGASTVPRSEDSPRRAQHACAFCRRRKLRCDGEQPCRQCERRNQECDYSGAPARRARGSLPAATASSSASMTKFGASTSSVALHREPVLMSLPSMHNPASSQSVTQSWAAPSSVSIAEGPTHPGLQLPC